MDRKELESVMSKAVEKVLSKHKQSQQPKVVKTSQVPTPQKPIERAWSAQRALTSAYQRMIHKKATPSLYDDK